MSFLSSTGRIVLIKEPISGRFGMPRLLAKLASNSLKVDWDGEEKITIITFNKRRSIAKVLKYEISYFKSLQIVLLRLKVTSVISFVGSQFIPNSLVESLAMSLCIPQRPFIGDKTITILPVADNIDIPYLCRFFSSSATDCSILSSVL